MHRSFTATKTRRYRLGAVASLALALVVGFVTFAPAASAHHPEITAKVECDTADGFRVAFESISWQTSGGNGGGGKLDELATAHGDPSEFNRRLKPQTGLATIRGDPPATGIHRRHGLRVKPAMTTVGLSPRT